VIEAFLKGDLLTVELFKTTINAQIFTRWIIENLIPKLPPNSVVIMDNASFHKSKDMQTSIQSNGHTLLYLPTYSPDLNPIEHKWAQVKSLRRKTQCKIEALFSPIVRNQFILL
jgi:transposase